jgi:hypothetical protein
MASLNNDIYDKGLEQFNSKVTALHILSADPVLAWGNIATLSIGIKTGLIVPMPSIRAAGGREVVVPAISDGEVTVTERATHYALVDAINTKILASGQLAGQDVTDGNPFTLTSFSIGIPAPL